MAPDLASLTSGKHGRVRLKGWGLGVREGVKGGRWVLGMVDFLAEVRLVCSSLWWCGGR